ncbi:hypothetical protein TNCV_3326061 [Trichonephila clavipes]|nr:hypothetical protein TNCV_3326061 [Trichonephila clavipes]
MTLEYPLDRRSTLSFGRFSEYSQLLNLGIRQSAFHLTSSATLTKSNSVVCCDLPRTLPDLEDSISRNVPNISQNPLRSTVEHTVLRFQIVAENDGHHGEPLLL